MHPLLGGAEMRCFMGLFGKKKLQKPEDENVAQGREAAQPGQDRRETGSPAAGGRTEESRERGSQPVEKQPERKEYIRGAGGTIVTKSILSGASKLKWMFRQEGGPGNGWVAFGDTDSQEYVNDANNMAVVDFNTLANIEPTVVNIFHMPMGSDLEFCSDKRGKYFVDTRTGKEIREPVKHPAQIAFEKNLKFLNQETYPLEFFQMLFTGSGETEVISAGTTDFPTGEVVLADPMAYLGSKYETVLDRRIPPGSYPVELSVFRSRIAGLRIAAARLMVCDRPPVRYELAMPKGKKIEDLGKPGVWTFFGVDAGLASFADSRTSSDYRNFLENWQKENPGKNKYLDYFAPLFRKSYEANPEVQTPDGNFIEWRLPETGQRIVFFTSGMGDGMYSGYWGLDENGETVCLVAPFMNPELF